VTFLIIFIAALLYLLKRRKKHAIDAAETPQAQKGDHLKRRPSLKLQRRASSVGNAINSRNIRRASFIEVEKTLSIEMRPKGSDSSSMIHIRNSMETGYNSTIAVDDQPEGH
jgi:hypothetical protein